MPKFSDLPTASRLDLDNDYLLINIHNGLNNYQTQKITGNDLIYSTCLPNDITNLFESISTLENGINNLDSTSAEDSQTLNALVELLNYDGTDSGHLYRIEDLEDAISDLQNSGSGLTEEQANLLDELTSTGDLYTLNRIIDLLDYSSTNSGELTRIDNLENTVSQMQSDSGGLTEEQADLLNQITLFESFSDDTGGRGVGPFIDNYNNLWDNYNYLWEEINTFNGYYDCGVSDFLSNYEGRCNEIDTIQNNLYYLEDGDIEIFKRIAELLSYNASNGGMIARIDTLENDLEDLENAIQGGGGLTEEQENLLNQITYFESFEDCTGNNGIGPFVDNYNSLYGLVEILDNEIGGFYAFEESDSHGVGPFISNYNELWNTVNNLNGGLTEEQINLLNQVALFENFADNVSITGVGPFIENYNSLWDVTNNLSNDLYNQVLNNDHPIMTWDTTNACWTAYDGYREGNAIIGFDPDEVYDYISSDVPIHATFPVFINTPGGVWNTLNGGLVDGGIPT